MTTNQLLQVNPDLVLRQEDDGAVLFDPETGAVHLLNVSAAAIMTYLEKPATLDSVMAALREEFDGIDDQAEEQVEQLMEQLLKMNAIKTA